MPPLSIPRNFNSPKWEILTLLGILAFVAALPLYHDITRNFIANADHDIEVAYLGVWVLSDKPLPSYDDPVKGATQFYVHILLLGAANWLADLLGLIETSDADAILDPARFDELFAQIIFVGRFLSIVFAVTTTWVIWATAKELTDSKGAAMLAAGLFAGSLGLGAQSSLIEQELPSTLFLLTALWMLVRAIRQPVTGWSADTALALSGFFFFLAMMTKVQAVFTILPLVIFPFVFADARAHGPGAPDFRKSVQLAVFVIVFSFPAVIWLISAIPKGATGFPQILVVLFIGTAVVAYSVVILKRPLSMVHGLGALLIGVAAAQYLYLLKEADWAVRSVVNFYDHMSGMAEPGSSKSAAQMLLSLPVHMVSFAADYLHPRHLLTKHYPFLLVYWANAIGIVLLIAQRRYRIALTVSMFLGLALLLPAIFYIRYYSYDYVIYVEPWAILGIAVAFGEWFRVSPTSKLAIGLSLMLCLVVSGLQIRYRLLAPATANTRSLIEICAPMKRLPDLAEVLRPHCERESKAATTVTPTQ